MTLITKTKWIQEQKAREAEAIKNGYSTLEIATAYKINREGRRVSYIDKWSLLAARKQIKKNGK